MALPPEVQRALALAAQAYGANQRVLEGMAIRESGGRNVVNNWDSNAAAGTPSAGILQFIKPTFDAYARHAREANPQAWRGVPMDWRNPQAQALAAAWAITNGHGSAWTTYKSALKDAGAKDARGAAPAPAAPAAPAQQYGLSEAGPSPIAHLLPEDSFLRSYMERRASDPVATPLHNAPARPARAPGMGGSSGGVPKRRPGETGQQYLDRVLGQRFGLKHDPGNSQTTGGHHVAGSDHYRGTATDFGNALNDPAVLQQAEDWVEAHASALGIKQSLYGEDEAEGHGNHLHVSTLRSLRQGSKRL